MAWELLRTDYKDAVPNGAQKYEVVQNTDGTVSITDVTEYIVKEDAFFGALDANKINAAVNAIMASLEAGTDLYEAFNIFFENQKDLFTKEEQKYFLENQNIFLEWFEQMKDQLSEDAAGSLQAQIDAVNSKIYVHDGDPQKRKEVYVDSADGNDASGDGSIDKPFKTLTKAVSVAPPVYSAVTNPDRYPQSDDGCFLINIVGESNLAFEGDVEIVGKNIEICICNTAALPRMNLNNSSVKLVGSDNQMHDIDFIGEDGKKIFDVDFYSKLFLGYLHMNIMNFGYPGVSKIGCIIESSHYSYVELDHCFFDVDTFCSNCLYVSDMSTIHIGNMADNYDTLIQFRKNIRGINHILYATGRSFIYATNDIVIDVEDNYDYYTDGLTDGSITSRLVECHNGAVIRKSGNTSIVRPNSAENYSVDSWGLCSGFNVAQLGNNNISNRGDGSVTGAIKYAADLAAKHESKLGTADISNRGDGTVTGAIKYAADLAARHENELTNYIATGSVTFPSTSIAADATSALEVAIPAKTGYKVVCLTTGNTGNNGLLFRALQISNSKAQAVVRNITSAAITASAVKAVVLYQRT